MTAFREGWRLEQGQDFAAILQCESSPAVLTSDGQLASSTHTAHFQQWQSEGRSGVWLHLPLSLASLAPEAASVGFSLHHASPEQGSVVMCAWLEEGAASRLPHYASHHVGVSGEGTGRRRERLSVFSFPWQVWSTGRTWRRFWLCRISSRLPWETTMELSIRLMMFPLQFVKWKFPGGLAEPSEDIGKSGSSAV